MEKNNLPAVIIDDTLPSEVIPYGDSGLFYYLKKVNSYPILTAEEEYMLAKSYLKEDDLSAAQKLITSHLKLVAKIALGYKNYGLPITELISEGNMGLMHAVKKFDPEMGNRLSTYAMWWIKAAIQEYILRSWSLVKIGTTSAHKKLFFSLNKIKNKIRHVHSREINSCDYKKIASELGVSESEVSDMDRRLTKNDLYLNDKYSEDSESEIIDNIPETRPSQEVMISENQDKNIKRKLLFEAISQLSKRELEIITMRKLQDPPTTLDEISKKYDISKERVRQIENRSFEKIQKFILEKSSKFSM